MFRAPRCAVLGIGLMLAAASTEARELQLSIVNRIGGDSNVFRRSADRTADGFYAISPRVIVHEGHSKLNYDFSYQPTYQTYFETSGIDGFDHWGQADLSWRPTAADTLGFNGNFTSRRNLQLEDRGGATLEESDRERVQNSDAALSYSRMLNEVLSVQASAAFTDRDFSRNTSVDSRSYSGQLGTQYVLNPITMVGLSGSFRRREDRGVGLQFRGETDIWNLAASFQRSLTPTLSISAQVGPSFFRSRRKSQFSFIPDSKSRSTSYFAAATLDKTWQRSYFGASYTRSESSGGGSTSSSIVDNITLNFDHRFSRRWSFRVQGTWLESKEVAEAVGASKQKTTQYRASVSTTRRITRRMSVIGQFSYFNQDQNQTTFGSQSIGDVYTGFLSVRYIFDPVKF
jgi:hypothetical protein